MRLNGVAGAEQQEADGEVGDGTGQHEEPGVGFGGGVIRGGGEGHEASDGEKEKSAEAEADVGGGDRPRDLAYEDGRTHAQPQGHTASGTAGFDDGEDDRDDQEEKERNVDAQIDIHEPADGDGGTQHGFYCRRKNKG